MDRQEAEAQQLQDQEFGDYAPNQVASDPFLVPGIKDCERTGPQIAIRGTGDNRK